ncbi:MAG: hypothetical protein R3B48_24175 [Kofleriaceae bacterium]
MTARSSTSYFSVLLRAAAAALQGRLLVLWLVGLWLPTAIVSLPLFAALRAALDHSLASDVLAVRFDGALLGDVLASVGDQQALPGAALLAAAVTLLLSPLLSGLVITAIRGERRLGFAQLLQGAVVEYGPLLRLLILGLVLLGAAAAVGGSLLDAADQASKRAIVETEVAGKARWALIATLALLGLVHATLEAARAQLAADAALRSALRAWWRGVKQVVRRPLATLGTYAAFGVVGYLVVAVLGLWRLRLPAASTSGFILALVVTQLLSLATAWMRTARLFALAHLARPASAADR